MAVFRGSIDASFTTEGVTHKVGYKTIAATLRKTYQGKFKLISDAVHKAVKLNFWPWKAQQMLNVWNVRKYDGATGSSGGVYPSWPALKPRYIKSKGNDTFWYKTGKFMGWLEAQTGKHTGPWNKLQPTESIRERVGWVNSGFHHVAKGSKGKKLSKAEKEQTWVPGRPIFVMTKADLPKYKNVVRQAIHDLLHPREKGRKK